MLYFTGKGDKGKTKFGNFNFSKDSLIFETLGELDEINSVIGLAKNYLPKSFFKNLTEIQNDFFIIQANVAYYLFQKNIKDKGNFSKVKFNFPKLNKDRIQELEEEIKKIEKKIKSQKGFVIYGSDRSSAWFDYLRAIARRVERKIIKFNKKHKLDDEILSYLNRLSSYFYSVARMICYNKKKKEKSPWY